MRKNNETRRGGYLERAPERVCSPADPRKISLDQGEGQVFVIRASDASEYLSFVPKVYVPGSPEPIGRLEITRNPFRARHFQDIDAAIAFLKKHHRATPLRPHGSEQKPICVMRWFIEPVPSPAERA
jgi:hypothetical protein